MSAVVWVQLADVKGADATSIPFGERVVVRKVELRVTNIDELKEAIIVKFSPDYDQLAPWKLRIKDSNGNCFSDVEQLLIGMDGPAGKSSKTPLLVELPAGEWQ